MSDDRYVIEWWRGVRLDRYTIQNHKRAESYAGFEMWPTQGSYNGYVVAASGGTHAGGGAEDISVRGWTRAKIDKAVLALRKAGFAAWYRPAIAGLWNAHIHCILVGNVKMSAAAAQQIVAFRNHRDGLRSNAYDPVWHPDPIKVAPYSVPVVFKPKSYYVVAPKLVPHSAPVSTTTNVLKGSLGYGSRLYIRGIKVVSGTTWGWTLRATGKAWWILEDRTVTTKPPAVVGTVRVATQNCAAQSKGHEGTWAARVPGHVRRWDESGADVVMLQEAGTNDTIYQRRLDDALALTEGLVRVNGGGKWRQIVRDRRTTEFVAARLKTLRTRVDEDGCQVFTLVSEVDGVRSSYTTIHFDLGATKAQKEALAEQAWAEAKAMGDAHRVFWMNRTIGGDTNDVDGVVDKVMAGHGLVSALTEAFVHKNADKKSTNRWTPEWYVGEQRDKVYGPAYAFLTAEMQHTYPDADHQYIVTERRLYAA